MAADNTDTELEQAYSSLNDSTASQIKNNVTAATGVNPDQDAGYQHLSKFMNMPVQSVRDNPEAVKAAANAQALDADKIAADTPHTAKFLTNPDNMNISHDDIQNLLATEGSLKTFGQTQMPNGPVRTVERTAADLLKGAGMAVGFLPDTIARLEYTGAQQLGIINKDMSVEDAQKGSIPNVTGSINTLVDQFLPEAKPRNKGEETADLAAQLVPAVMTSGPTGLLQLAARTGFGTLGVEAGANLQQRAEAFSDKYFPNQPFTKELLGQGANLLTMMGVSGGGHVAETTVSDFAAKRAEGYAKVQDAVNATTDINNLNTAAAQSKVRLRSSEAWNDFVKNASQEAPLKDLYISGATLAQEAGPKLEAILQDIPTVRDQIHAAVATGGDVRIPVEDFASKLAGTDLAQQLIPHLKADPDGFSQAQAEEYMQTQGADLQQQVEKVLNEKTNDQAFQTSRDNVEAGIMDQLRNVNRHPDQVNAPYARLLSNFYSVMGARLGKSPEEFASEYPIKIASDNAPVGFTQASPESRALGEGTSPVDREGVSPSSAPGEDFNQLHPQAEEHAKKVGRLANIEGDLENLRADPEVNKDKIADLEREHALTNKWIDDHANVVYQDQANINGTKLGSFNPQKLQINLLRGANLSTFLHESGHFFLHTMSDIAAREDAPTSIKEDMQKVMDWFGVKDVNEWNSKTINEQRDNHEKFARSFEQYLLNGEAPSLKMQDIFNKFRSWLVSIYKSVVPGSATISPDVRAVFDRMLASSEDIKDAETARGMGPMFSDAKEAGMTDEQFRQYKENDLNATQDAVKDLQTRRIKDMQWLSNVRDKAMRDLQSEAREKRQAIREEVTKEVKNEPVYAAENFLRRGEVSEDMTKGMNKEERRQLLETGLNRTKLNLDDLKVMYGEEANAPWRYLDTGKHGLAGENGIHPDTAAEMFGFSSGDELVKSLIESEPQRDKINGLIDQRMLERHGDLVDPVAVQRAAEAAIHNEARAKVVATELNALNKRLGNKTILTSAAKNFAEQMVGRQEAARLNPNQYITAATKAGRDATAAFKKGDIAEAALQKRNQLINQYAVKAAYEARRSVEGVLAQSKKLGNAAYREKIPGGYLEQIDKLLSRYDLRKGDAKEIARAQQNLTKWAESQRDAGFEPAIKDWLLDDPRDIKFKDMSVDEVRGLGDALKSMVYMAREMRKVFIAGETKALDMVVGEMVKPLIERGDKFTKEELLNPPQAGTDSFLQVALHKMGTVLRLSLVDLKPQDFKRNAYDLHDLEGPFGKYLFEPMFERNYWKNDRLRENGEYFRAWGKQLGPEWQKSLYDKVTNKTLIDPDLSGRDKKGNINKPVMMQMTRAKLLAMMAHVGNESNFDKLTRGYGWDPTATWKFIHENARKKDWDAVQAQGKIFEKYWPEIEALSRRLGGVPPDKIALRPVKTKFGTYDGWYAPIDYDPLRSKLSANYGDIMADPTESIGKQQPYRATTTNNGSMQNRSSGYTDRVRLDFHGFESRLKDTVHDLAYREQLISANKIINDKTFREQFLKTFGKEEYAGLQKWLKGIRDMNVDDSQNKMFDKFMNYTRQGIVSTGIAYRITTVLKHGSSAALKSLGYLGDGAGAKYFAARGARMATGNMMKDVSEARDKFSEIRTRMLQMDRDYKEGNASMYEPEDWRAKNDRYGHAMVAWSDALTAVPTAWAAYDRAINEGVPVKQGGTGKPMTEAQAVAYANKVVREAHGTALEANRSLFMQSKGAKGLFGTIYGFMNNTHGQMVDTFDKMSGASHFDDKPAVMARLTATLVVPALVASWVNGTGKQDPWYKWVAKAIAGEVAGTVPFVRDAWGMFEYGKDQADTVGPLRVASDVVNTVNDLYKEAHGKSSRLITDMLNSIGELFHIGGLGQAGKSLQYLRDARSGKQQPRSAMDVVKGVTVGPPPKH